MLSSLVILPPLDEALAELGPDDAWARAAAAAEMEAPFLWLRLEVVVVLADMLLPLFLSLSVALAASEVFLDGRERDAAVCFSVGAAETIEVASAKVPRDGVEGLLARPLLVLTVLIGVG